MKNIIDNVCLYVRKYGSYLKWQKSLNIRQKIWQSPEMTEIIKYVTKYGSNLKWQKARNYTMKISVVKLSLVSVQQRTGAAYGPKTATIARWLHHQCWLFVCQHPVPARSMCQHHQCWYIVAYGSLKLMLHVDDQMLLAFPGPLSIKRSINQIAYSDSGSINFHLKVSIILLLFTEAKWFWLSKLSINIGKLSNIIAKLLINRFWKAFNRCCNDDLKC